jgi:hypothetical protein
MNRVFVKAGPVLDYRKWLAALKAGRTFVSNGPLLAFSLNGREAGDEVVLSAGVHQLSARVTLRSLVPVEKLEIVANVTVVTPIELQAGGTRADAVISLPVARSGWYTLRAWSRNATHPVMDLYPFATTSPVYVTLGGKPLRSIADAQFFVRWIERLEAAAMAHQGWNTSAERSAVLDRMKRAREIFQSRVAGD